MKKAIGIVKPRKMTASGVTCPGCPHATTYYALKRAVQRVEGGALYSGDIGCHTLGANPPIDMQNTDFCMGASIGVGSGMSHAGVKEAIVTTIGDSTFIHAGIPALINSIYNQARLAVVVFDNRTTAMTGFQPHPGTGVWLGSSSSKPSRWLC